MAPTEMKGYGDAQLETGLLRTHEEKIPFIPTGLEQSRTGPTYCRPEAKETRKMPSLQRMVMIVMLSVLLGFGLALARDPSLSSSCIGWTCGDWNLHIKAARSFLAKRNDASVTNVTTPGAPTESAIISSEQPTTPTASATPTSSSHESTTTTPSSTIIVSSTSSPTSTPEPPTPSPSIIPPTSSTSSTIPNPTPPSTSTTSQGPESTPSGTSSTRHEAVSESSSSSVTPVSSSTPRETSTSSGPPLSTEESSSEAASTSSKIQKTITTGRVATTSPVPHVYTTTLPDGGTLTITSTSWVAIVPTDKSSASTGPQLQNYAPKAQAHSTLVFAVEALVIGMLLI